MSKTKLMNIEPVTIKTSIGHRTGRPKKPKLVVTKAQQKIVDNFNDYLRNLPERKKIQCEETFRRREHCCRRFLTEVVKSDVLDVDKPEFIENTKVWLSEHGQNPTYYNELSGTVKYLLLSLDREDIVKKYKETVFFYKSKPMNFLNLAGGRLPTLEQLHIFLDHINKYKYGEGMVTTEQFRLFFLLCLVTGARPYHVLQLTKKLFEKDIRKINTHKKVIDKKRFFFAFYTKEVQPLVESYLDTLPTADTRLFGNITRDTMKYYFKAVSKECGVKITPKTPRKVFTTWFRRANVREDIINLLTSHANKSIIDRYYVEHSEEELRAEYDRVMSSFPLLSDKVPEPAVDKKDALIKQLTEQHERDGKRIDELVVELRVTNNLLKRTLQHEQKQSNKMKVTQ